MKTRRSIILLISILFCFAAITTAGANDDGATRTFTVSTGGTVGVDVGSGEIIVRTWDKNQVHVEARGIAERDLHRLKMTQSGNTITVRYRASGGWFGGSRNVQFTLTLPTLFNLDARTSGGDVKIRGPLTGELRGATSGGDISLTNLGGYVTMTTSGGDIQAGTIEGDAFLKTSGGDIRLGSVSGEAEVSTSGGSIRVENAKKDLRARTSGGDITIGEVGGSISASTAGGDIKIQRASGSITANTAGGDIRINGGTGIVKAKTAGGDILLENISGSVEAKTAGGDVEVELIPSGSGRSRMVTAGGDVKLFLPENARATIEAVIRVHGWWGKDLDKYSIKSDFQAQSFERDRKDDSIRGTYILNGGGEDISLETVNSDIMIRKSRK